MIPYFWVQGADVEDMESKFSDHPGVTRIQFIDSVENDHLLRVEWSMEYNDVITILTEAEIALIEAVGTKQQWTFDIRGDDQRSIASFQRRCQELDIPITLTALHALTPVESDTEAF